MIKGLKLKTARILRRLLRWYFSKNALPYWCIIAIDSIIIFLSGLITFWVFYRSMVLLEHRFEVLCTLLMLVVLSYIGTRLFRTYSGIIRFSSFVDLLHVAYANTLTALLAIGVSEYMNWKGIYLLSALSYKQIIITFIVSTFAMWGLRILVKALYDASATGNQTMGVLIYGALSGGVGLAKNIRMLRPRRFILRGFISHEESKKVKNVRLMGEPVYTADDDLETIIKKKHIRAILVSPLRIDEFRFNQEMQDRLIGAGCKIFMSQPAKEASIKDGQIAEDEIKNIQLNEVSVEDLLPRSEIKVDLKSVASQLTGRRILITGSAGSIGSEIVRQIATFEPAKMMLIDQAETPEHDIRLMMGHEFPDVEAETIVTSICNQSRMEHIFKNFRPEYVFHAAAYKHVPMMENNPSEAVLNNVYGTRVIADLSAKYGVEKFVMVSTDKAVNPTNVMGCSKRICEIYVQSLNERLREESMKKHNSGTTFISSTQFVTTRFGNVLGSNGSVIPLFREQIKNGGPVTVTDKRIVRFFMLIPEACQLVLEAGTKGRGGEIFVFDMGKPVRIADLAKRMIALSGAKDVEIKYTGLREGEKLYEEVLNELEGTKPTFHEKIRIASVRSYNYDDACKQIDELIAIARNYDDMATVAKMKEIVPEYKSNNSIYETLDK